MIKADAKTWTIRYTRPRAIKYADGSERTYNLNHSSVVVAMTIAGAIRALQEQLPDATIISAHPGPIGATVVAKEAIE